MFKPLIYYPTLLATLMLTGCASAPRYEATLPEPRPVTSESSYAMQVTRSMKNTIDCLGCEDTVLWKDEKALANQVGFNVVENASKEHLEAEHYRRTVRKLQKEGKLTQNTLPPLPKLLRKQLERNDQNNPLRNDKASITNSMMLTDSIDGRWTNSNNTVGVGLALGLVSSMFETSDPNIRRHPPAEQMKAIFVLPPEKQIKFNLFKNYPTPEDNKFNNIAVYAGKQFVELLTKSAIDMGYKPVGEIQVRTYDMDTNPDWTFIWQPLENEAIGCPKITAKTHRWDMCRVEWARYSISRERTRYTWNLEKDVVPKILGGDGKQERWMQEFGYNRLVPSGLIVDDAKKLTDNDGDRNYRFALGLQKYLKPGQFIYVPSYELSNGKWSPQCVLDSKGTHYFSVVVPENRPISSTPVK